MSTTQTNPGFFTSSSGPFQEPNMPLTGRVCINSKELFFWSCFHSQLAAAAAAAAKSLQSCRTLCDPIDSSPPGSPVPGILQARTLEWVAISFSNAWRWKVKVKSLSRVRLFATPWTAAYQAPPSMGFSRQEYWSGVPSPCPHSQLTKPQKKVSFIKLKSHFIICPGWKPITTSKQLFF